MVELLLNCVGETVTTLLNQSYDGSWLTQLVLVLTCHETVVHNLCYVVCHLVNRQAHTLSECHIHALAALLVHLNSSAAVTVKSGSHTLPFVSYIVQSLPVSTLPCMSFSLLFAASYAVYADMVRQDSTITQSVDVPDDIHKLLSYLGPRLVKDLRSDSPRLASRDWMVSHKFLSVERFLLSGSVRGSLERSRMSFDSWVQQELEVDGEDVSAQWLMDYYNWVVFSRWHQPSSAGSVCETYMTSVCVVLARAVIDCDTKLTQRHTCRCMRPHSNKNGRLNIISLLQASNTVVTRDHGRNYWEVGVRTSQKFGRTP